VNEEAWKQLAIQAPIVLIFGGMVYLIMREQARSVREQSVSMKQLIDMFMLYMDKRDEALTKAMTVRDETLTRTMDKIVARLDSHDEQAKVIMNEARTHDTFVRERFKELGS
jgi:hypothetical protein